jgi:hypothetical protein
MVSNTAGNQLVEEKEKASYIIITTQQEFESVRTRNPPHSLPSYNPKLNQQGKGKHNHMP